MPPPLADLALLDALPYDCFELVLTHATPAQLARISCVSKGLNATIGRFTVWQRLVRQRWPKGAQHVGLYGGDWRRMFSARKALPSALPPAADQARAATAAAAATADGAAAPRAPLLHHHQLAAAFEVMARALKVAAEALASAPKLVAASAELAMIKEDAGWWLRNHPQVAIRFVLQARQSLLGGPCARTPAPEWQRDAAATLLRLSPQGVCPSVLERLAREAELLDASIRQQRAACCAAVASVAAHVRLAPAAMVIPARALVVCDC